VVRFYNKRGTAEQWIKEGKQAVKMTRLSCHRFRSNQVRLALSLLASNLGNLCRRLALPKRIENWSLTSLQPRLVKTGGRPLKHARYYWLFLAESHLTKRLFGSMLGESQAGEARPSFVAQTRSFRLDCPLDYPKDLLCYPHRLHSLGTLVVSGLGVCLYLRAHGHRLTIIHLPIFNRFCRSPISFFFWR
jgi:hypothetical protein